MTHKHAPHHPKASLVHSWGCIIITCPFQPTFCNLHAYFELHPDMAKFINPASENIITLRTRGELIEISDKTKELHSIATQICHKCVKAQINKEKQHHR